MLALSVLFYLSLVILSVILFHCPDNQKVFSSLNRRQMDFLPQANANTLTGSSLQAKQAIAIRTVESNVYSVDPSGQVKMKIPHIDDHHPG